MYIRTAPIPWNNRSKETTKVKLFEPQLRKQLRPPLAVLLPPPGMFFPFPSSNPTNHQENTGSVPSCYPGIAFTLPSNNHSHHLGQHCQCLSAYRRTFTVARSPGCKFYLSITFRMIQTADACGLDLPESDKRKRLDPRDRN